MNKTDFEKDKPYWIAFNVFQGVGPITFAELLRQFKSARAVWEEKEENLAPVLGRALWEKFQNFRSRFEPKNYLKKIKKEKNIEVLILPEKKYPSLLKEIEDAPPVLYVLGSKEVLQEKQIAMVGTRKMTNYGAKVARDLTRSLVYAGFVITSGLAYGIDTVAHRTALQNEGETVAVLGCGVDVCYPKGHRKVYEKIIKKGGSIVSEVPPGMKTKRGIFVARNRIISGLSAGVVVVEGAKKSGTLITAGYAAEQGKDLFAVPGPINSQYSEAPNMLIKEGAVPVTDAKDILREFKEFANKKLCLHKKTSPENLLERKNLSREEKSILKILIREQVETVHIDVLTRKAGLDSKKTAGALSMLELKGVVENKGGAQFALAE